MRRDGGELWRNAGCQRDDLTFNGCFGNLYTMLHGIFVEPSQITVAVYIDEENVSQRLPRWVCGGAGWGKWYGRGVAWGRGLQVKGENESVPYFLNNPLLQNQKEKF